MRRMRFALLPVLAALVVLAACRRTDDALTIALALLPSELSVYRAVVAEFERESGLRVVVVPQQYADVRRALAAEASSTRGGTLDLVELDVYSLAAASRHAGVIGEEEVPELAAFAPAVVRAGRVDGLRFVPHRVTWQALIYDHDALGKPPATWDELLAVARAHPRRIGLKGSRYEGLTCDILPFVWAAGGRGDAFDDPAARRAFQLFAALAPYLHPHSATFKEATVAEAMARGELVLHLNWPFAMSLYASQGLAPGRIRSAPLPRGPDARATVLGGGYLAVPRSTRHRDAAIRLVRFLLGRSAQDRFARELGWFSPRGDVALPAAGGVLDGYVAMRGETRPRPERADYPRLSALWQQAFRRVAFEGVAPDTALRDAARAWTEVTR